jgi:acetolactate synthase-1/2/3 large subunit
MTNGARTLIQTLVNAGVITCFTNPGTSEMHFVAALDEVPGMRAVLTLFEGVATGAADGYARMTGTPAATLLHLGPGLGNGLANLHNARRARVPVVNVIGDHATFHTQYDAPLQSDIETVARNVSGWVRTVTDADDLGRVAAAAVAAAAGPPGQVATLIVPADLSWNPSGDPASLPAPTAARPAPAAGSVDAAAEALASGKPAAFLLGGNALSEAGLVTAGRIAAATGAKLIAETFPTRMTRGEGLPPVQRLAYLPEVATGQLAGFAHLVLAGAKPPVSFFGYPGESSEFAPTGCQVHELAAPDDDAVAGLEAVAGLLDAEKTEPLLQEPFRPSQPSGELTAEKVAQAIGFVLPAGAIVSDEAQTSGFFLPRLTAGAPRHDWLALTGGAIGQGLPVAVGAAVACPDRPVFALEADGSAAYTIQALWTMARENLDVTVVLFNNRAYSILNLELSRVGAGNPGPRAKAQLDLHDPDIDFVSVSRGFGVPASRPATGEQLVAALEAAVSEPGPHLVEVVIPEIR